MHESELSTDIHAIIASHHCGDSLITLSYQQLLHLEATIEDAARGRADFPALCCAAVCRRWDHLSDQKYILAYYLHFFRAFPTNSGKCGNNLDLLWQWQAEHNEPYVTAYEV